MIYSVYNWNARAYDYFEGAGDEQGMRPKPRRVLNSLAGLPPEAALQVVPPGAVFRGRGTTPQGRIAVQPGEALGGFVEDLQKGTSLQTYPWATLAVWIGVGLVSFKAIQWMGKRLGESVR